VVASTDLAITPPDADLSPSAEREFGALWRLAKRFAASDLVPKELKGKPESCFLQMAYGQALGLAPAHSLTALWVINGRVEPSAQVRIGVAIAHGHDVVTEETSSERCTIAVRRRGSDTWQRVTYTIEDAERAGALDEWVERWQQARNSDKRYKLTHVVTCRCGRHEGIEEPQWATEERQKGNLHRKDPWFAFRDDMLWAATARRATKRFTPDAFLQLAERTVEHPDADFDAHPGDYGEPDVHEQAGAAAAGPEVDDEIADAEVVEPEAEVPVSPPSSREAEPEAPAQAGAPLAGPAFSRSFAIDCAKAEIEADGRHALVAYATGGRTRTSKEVHKGAEAGACFAALAGVQEGRLSFSVADDDEVIVVDKETA
jgi:hypothetical protein